MPGLRHRALVNPILLDVAQPSIHILPGTALGNKSELQHELHRERHHRVCSRYGVVNKVACPANLELGIEPVHVLTDVFDEGGVVLVGGGG